MSHADMVRAMYAAFGRGDVKAIVENLAPDVEWDCDHGSNDIPWLQPIRGSANVPRFFAALAEHMDLRRFEPKVILESGDTVLVMYEVEAYARKTGKRIQETQCAHIWQFNPQGKVTKYKNAVDTLAAAKALNAA
jgi:uncharacterized protein